MKRLIVGIASSLVFAVTLAPGAQAQTQPTPADLASLARNGYFAEQGIPSHARLDHAVQFDQVSAADVVRAAVQTGRIESAQINNESLLNALQTKLDGHVQGD
ncbi:MAG: hypothetical protein MUF49_31080 [Oculatellaceae cyanobacterium Prado106]|jgi:hypothetical protein|nr:hypothetical protein [Oculatellaceae cyanobacterium Prado106]